MLVSIALDIVQCPIQTSAFTLEKYLLESYVWASNLNGLKQKCLSEYSTVSGGKHMSSEVIYFFLFRYYFQE